MIRHQFYEDFFARFGQERAAKFVLALHRQFCLADFQRWKPMPRLFCHAIKC